MGSWQIANVGDHAASGNRSLRPKRSVRVGYVATPTASALGRIESHTHTYGRPPGSWSWWWSWSNLAVVVRRPDCAEARASRGLRRLAVGRGRPRRVSARICASWRLCLCRVHYAHNTTVRSCGNVRLGLAPAYVV